METPLEIMFVSVILPLKFRGEISYTVPAGLSGRIKTGSRVKVEFGRKIYSGVVEKVESHSQITELAHTADDTFAKQSPQSFKNQTSGEQIFSGNTAKSVRLKEILAVEDLPAVGENEIRLWHKIAEYYMCTVGEVFKAAYPDRVIRQESVKARKTAEQFFEAIGKQSLDEKWEILPETESESKSEPEPTSGTETRPKPESESIPELTSGMGTRLKPESEPIPEPTSGTRTKLKPEPGQEVGDEPAERNKTAWEPVLSTAQQEAFEQIGKSFRESGKPVLLQGVTGSGKTEIYIRLALEQLRRGQNVLYMVPEIAVSKQLQLRLKKVFGERLLTFHSKQTLAEKSRIHKILSGQQEKAEGSNDAVIVLGTRSALFLPYKKLGLIVVDEEHDSSYKQTEPAPRYHARDTAIMLAALFEAHIILGSATPSFESEYNCSIGRFGKVRLEEKYYGAREPEVEIIDTLWAYKSRQMKGSFSRKLINEIKAEIARGGQVLVFRNRRSYAPAVECTECGCIPKCPHCNVYLSYHKYDNTLRCHYCEYTARFSGICPSCGRDALRYKGTGTEKLEEELKELFPDSRIARFDADVAKSKRAEEQVLKDFAKGETDILVGTQMISKGFDFGNLNLVAVIQADTILGIQDFRGDERALQLFSQLMGRTGRRGKRGKLLIQTNQKDHPVLLRLQESARHPAAPDKNRQIQAPADASVPMDRLLAERKEFNFPPFVRMVKIIVKHRNPEKLDEICRQITQKLASLPCREFTGPFAPPIDKVRGEWIKCFYIKYARDARLAQNKALLIQALETLKGAASVLSDVDPL